jgi:4'-phosphopantetheinyl transferase
MPIVRRWSLGTDCQVAIWETTETAAELAEQLTAQPDEWEEWLGISHPQKQLEWLAGRVALQTLLRENELIFSGLLKDEHGKPHLRHSAVGVSITHTNRFIGAVYCANGSVGIDLERTAEKLARIAPKFLSETELAHAQGDWERLNTYWCAKEALYKLHGTHELYSFKTRIAVQPFEPTDPALTGSVLLQDTWHAYRLFRFFIDDFVGVVAR